jgi:protein phosphatase
MNSRSNNSPAAKSQLGKTELMAGDRLDNSESNPLTAPSQSEGDFQPELESKNAPYISPPILMIREGICFKLDNFRIEVESHLGQSIDVNYFQVKIYPINSDLSDSSQLGLLRVGLADGSLNRELQLRQVLGDYKMISDLLIYTTEEFVQVSSNGAAAIASTTEESPCQPRENEPENWEFLPEEMLEAKEIGGDLAAKKLLLLSHFPETGQTLAEWLRQEKPLDASLLLGSQICQLFRYIYQRGWCLVSVWPELIQMGTPVKLFDLTGAYPVGEKLTTGIVGDYCPPELTYPVAIDEQMSTYIVGVLLYQSIHQKLPRMPEGSLPEIKPIARIAQIISICLSPMGDRFPLAQLLSLLIETRQMLLQPSVYWTVAKGTTVGLSPQRLQNEDSYGVRQQYLSNSQKNCSTILAAVADGMGGMAQGEEASRLAIQTVLSAPIPPEINHIEQWNSWLISLIEKANAVVAKEVPKGGTTLSLVYAIDRDLTIAHVGDSRIFLLRNGQICQLSEDHSLTAMLLASGEISYEESKHHRDRNILTKSIGGNPILNSGYVQNLSHFGGDLSIPLETGDILLLCTDGVWDLVATDELAEIFSGDRSLQSSVDAAIDQVLAKGAPDNATLIALEYRLGNK